jgi:hypothetical protein
MKLYVPADAKAEIERARELQRRGVPIHLIRVRTVTQRSHDWRRYALPAALAGLIALLLAAD